MSRTDLGLKFGRKNVSPVDTIRTLVKGTTHGVIGPSGAQAAAKNFECSYEESCIPLLLRYPMIFYKNEIFKDSIS